MGLSEHLCVVVSKKKATFCILVNLLSADTSFGVKDELNGLSRSLYPFSIVLIV